MLTASVNGLSLGNMPVGVLSSLYQRSMHRLWQETVKIHLMFGKTEVTTEDASCGFQTDVCYLTAWINELSSPS